MNIRFGINQFYKQTWTTILSTFHIRFPLACEDQRHVSPTIFPFETIWSRRQRINRDSNSSPVSVSSFPSKYPPPPLPISISRSLRRNDVGKKRKGKINVLNWSNRWQEWKLHVFSWLSFSLSFFKEYSSYFITSNIISRSRVFFFIPDGRAIFSIRNFIYK